MLSYIETNSRQVLNAFGITGVKHCIYYAYHFRVTRHIGIFITLTLTSHEYFTSTYAQQWPIFDWRGISIHQRSYQQTDTTRHLTNTVIRWLSSRSSQTCTWSTRETTLRQTKWRYFPAVLITSRLSLSSVSKWHIPLSARAYVVGMIHR